MAKSDYQIALEVIAGQWGNGQDRMVRLTKAGYDAVSVQNIVNQIIYDGYSEPVSEPDQYLDIEVDLAKYAGIQLRFRKDE